jgi:hypothetical protein
MFLACCCVGGVLCLKLLQPTTKELSGEESITIHIIRQISGHSIPFDTQHDIKVCTLLPYLLLDCRQSALMVFGAEPRCLGLPTTDMFRLTNKSMMPSTAASQSPRKGFLATDLLTSKYSSSTPSPSTYISLHRKRPQRLWTWISGGVLEVTSYRP